MSHYTDHAITIPTMPSLYRSCHHYTDNAITIPTMPSLYRPCYHYTNYTILTALKNSKHCWMSGDVAHETRLYFKVINCRSSCKMMLITQCAGNFSVSPYSWATLSRRKIWSSIFLNAPWDIHKQLQYLSCTLFSISDNSKILLTVTRATRYSNEWCTTLKIYYSCVSNTIIPRIKILRIQVLCKVRLYW
jgi:hypothetical protein